MKYAIISDIHSNYHALVGAVASIKRHKINKIICLGDIVGYNANPIQCIDYIRNNKIFHCVIQGNHERHSVDKNLHPMELSHDAYVGILHTRKCIEEAKTDYENYLCSLPIKNNFLSNNYPVLLTHGSPNDLFDIDGYMYDNHEAIASFRCLKDKHKARLGFFGHTHVPTFAMWDGINPRKVDFKIGDSVVNTKHKIDEKYWYVVNPGAIGQPRMGISSSYVIFDTKHMTIEFVSFDYDWKAAQEEVLKAGYSEKIAARLDPPHSTKNNMGKKHEQEW